MRGRAALPVLAAVAFAAGTAVTIAVAARGLSDAQAAASRSVARMAAELWELSGGADEAARSFLDAGIAIDPMPAPAPGQPATGVEPGESSSGPGAHAYRAGSLRPAVWIAVPPQPRESPLPPAATALALLGSLLMSAWAVARRRAPPRPGYPTVVALIATTLLGTVAAATHRWADRELEALSERHADHALRAVEAALALGTDPDRAARVAGLPWATSAALTQPDQLWTMPRDIGEAVAAIPDPPTATPFTVEAAGATWHAGLVALPTQAPATPSANLHLALLGYEETRAPTVPLAAAATAASLLTVLILFLLPLSARPPLLRRTVTAWAFLAPAALLLAVFTFGPLLFSLWISLHEWHLVDPVHPFVGLDKYRHILLDGDWWAALRNTAIFTLHVPLAMAAALALALLTRGSRRTVHLARLALFLPGITSVVAIAVVWKWLLNDGYGPVNRLLGSVGVAPVSWLTSPEVALVTLMAISVWMIVGYQMVVFQAGLAAIPRDWYDAARVDGAGALQRFRHITLPGLRHTLFFVLVTSVIGSFQVFGLVYVMTEGGPLGATDVAVYHIYREAWEFLRFGNAAAMSWILFAVVFVATWLHFRLLERRTLHA
ncbi:MAG: ABC transporter permease subunit [Gemmatimonadetes bacterium]|nr:ABC transporter permease subunit [Gemmatimonadota bacterium]